jgi:WD40 repeat protein
MSEIKTKSTILALVLLILILSACHHRILQDKSVEVPQYTEITQLGFADVHSMTWNGSNLLAFASSSTRIYSQLTGIEYLLSESIGSSNDIEWNPTGEWLAGAGATVWLTRNDETTVVLAPLEETRYYNDIAWSPDGNKLAAASSGRPDFGDQSVWIWDVNTSELIDSVSISDFPVSIGISSETGFSDVQWDSSGTLLSMSTVSGKIVIWNLSSREPFSVTRNDERYPDNIVFSPHSNEVAFVFSEAGLIEIWDTFSGRMISSLEVENYYLNFINWHPRERVIGIISEDSLLSWNIEETQYRLLLDLTQDIVAIEWIDEEGIFLATESSVYLWNDSENDLSLLLNEDQITMISVNMLSTTVAVGNEQGVYLFSDK